MDYSLRMRGGQPARNLEGVINALSQGEFAALQTLAHRLAFQQFRDHIRRAIVRSHVIYCQYVRVVERAGGFCFLFKALQLIGGGSEVLWQNLYRDVAPERRISGAIDTAHA